MGCCGGRCHEREVKPVPSDEAVLIATKVLMDACHSRAWNAGWFHNPATGEEIERNHGEMFALIHSEISEAMEAHRKDLMDDKLTHRKGEPVELFDAAIRIFDMIGRYYPEDYPAMLEKMKYNDKREDHKAENRLKAGGKRC